MENEQPNEDKAGEDSPKEPLEPIVEESEEVKEKQRGILSLLFGKRKSSSQDRFPS